MKKALPFVVVILSFCLESSGQPADSIKYKSLEPYDFHLAYLKDDKAILIDVREFFEYKKSRIKDALNIPSSGNIDFAADTIGKDKSLFLYCTTDYRSKRVAEKLAEKGFASVFSLEGGIKAWKKDGFQVERKKLRKGDGETR
jgi:rhodanese-related sulfurtransferase